MKYSLLVSHGDFAGGLKTSLAMFAEDKMDQAVAAGLKSGKTVDDSVQGSRQAILGSTAEDSVIVLADIISDSPLTTACSVLDELGKLDNVVIPGGTNLPMAITSAAMKDMFEGDASVQAVLPEAQAAPQEFKIASDDEKDDIQLKRRLTMTVSSVCIDDRMIHGQTVTRQAKEYSCDGLIAINDAAAGNKVLIQAYKGASDKKTFVWTVDASGKKSQKVLDSDTKYFVITKNPIDMKKLLVDQGSVPSDVKEIIIGPCNNRPGAVKLDDNQSIIQEEVDAVETIEKVGYKVKSQLLPDVSIGHWSDFKSRFGY